MVNASSAAAIEHVNTETADSGSFARDTVIWAFAKLAECTLGDLFQQPAERARYTRWLTEEAPLLVEGAGQDQGLLLIDWDLGADGRVNLIARPREGEFILTVSHQCFELVLASSYAMRATQPEQECICVAHFEGDSALAARWASGLRHSLERRRQSPAASLLEKTQAAPDSARLH